MNPTLKESATDACPGVIFEMLRISKITPGNAGVALMSLIKKATLPREEAKGAKNFNILAKGIQISREENVSAKLLS